MRYLNIDTSVKKKIRGKKRKSIDMVEGIIRDSKNFPNIDIENGYWHMHLPIKQSFINSDKTPIKVKRQCIQTIIDCTNKLISMKPKSAIPVRVIAYVNFPDLWYSEIIVFFGDNYYKGYFERDNEYQKWIPLEDKRDIVKEWNIKIPNTFVAKGYKEILYNDDSIYKNELWYLGEVEK